MFIFDYNHIAFTALGYDMSYLELIATIAGLIAVWLSAREHIWNWPIGLVNVVFSYVLFFKTGFYSDALLQIYFFITGVYGWWLWSARDTQTAESRVKIGFLTTKQQIYTGFFIVIMAIIFGYLTNHLHGWYPSVFPVQAAFPYADSLVMMMSVVGNLLLTVKKIEAWILWVIVDIIAPFLYFQKGILLITFEYVIFLILSIFALWNWLSIYKKQQIKIKIN